VTDSNTNESVSKPSNFLRQIIESDLSKGTYAQRLWAGQPSIGTLHALGQPDPAKIRTRFPPEPNGYLHIGHAKSICLNFGLAQDYNGVCHLRFDDTNPEKEDQSFVDAIEDTVKWLGFDWQAFDTTHRFQASDYFETMHSAAQYLIEQGLAYVDEQTSEDMRNNRGDFSKPGVNSPFRDRSVAANLARFAQMRAGDLPDGAAVVRAKIDMASPNINMRDPAIYRIRHAHHHHTGDTWCIYPMYTFAHPIEDALENITHSICTLEFEDQRPFYDWLLDKLSAGGIVNSPPPKQYEFARLNLTYVVTSKRKLAQLVVDNHVTGWDDPRMPTIVGLRRRGYTPEALRLFTDRIGVSKSDSWIDYATLEGSLRDTLDTSAARAMAVLDPIRLHIENWSELMGEGALDTCTAPVHPHHPERGERTFMCGADLWIERGDYEQAPAKGYFRLFPGNKVRLKYGHVVECTGANYNAAGDIEQVNARLVPDTKSGTPGASAIKVKGVITWVGDSDAVSAPVRLYDRLFQEAQPDAGGRDFIAALNPNSLLTVQAKLEPCLAHATAGSNYQFERLGYFVADHIGSTLGAPVFNRSVGLKDTWASK
jgi:glutaminyl-tRNA synthetase